MESSAVGSAVALKQEGPGWEFFSACSLRVLHVHALVLSKYFGFLPQSKNMLNQLVAECVCVSLISTFNRFLATGEPIWFVFLSDILLLFFSFFLQQKEMVKH